MSTPTRRVPGLLSLLLVCTAPVGAEEWIIVGPRAMGMGGAGVATSQGAYGMYWNPASLALPFLPGSGKRDAGGARNGSPQAVSNDALLFDVSLHASATVAALGDTLADLARVNDLVESLDFDTIEAKFAGGTPFTAAEVQDTLRLLQDLEDLDERGEGMYITTAAGVGVSAWRIGLAALSLGYGGAQPVVDLVNGVALGDNGIDTVLSSLPAPGPAALNAASQSFADTLSTDGLATQADAEALLFQAQQAGIDTADAAFQENVVSVLTATQNAEGSGDAGTFFTNNQSGARLRGIILNELDVGYAHPIFDWLAVGASLRLIYGISYVDPFQLSEIASQDDFFEDLYEDENREESFNVGVDVGVLVRPVDWITIGLTAKNLNQPEFESNFGPDFTLDPQVRAGVAVSPLDWITVAADLDLIPNHSDVVPGYESQVLGVGAEFRLFDLLALRAGLSDNLRESEDEPVLHAGVGLRVWYFHLDAAVLVPVDFSELEDLGNIDKDIGSIDDLPPRVGLSLLAGFTIPF